MEDRQESERAQLFPPIGSHVGGIAISENAEDSSPVVDEIESMCMNCHQDVSRCIDPGNVRILADCFM